MDLGVELYKFELPRKSLGDRNRAQAHRFHKLSCADRSQRIENLQWAEQSARQAILHDYSNFQNWEILLKLKLELNDESGIYALFEDLLSVLGKDSELLAQLKSINLIPSSMDLFSSILKREPLDADAWWKNIKNNNYNLEDFSNRCKKMDFRDRRSNVIFGRRLERIRKHGLNDIFSELMPYLLSHRPDNFELWLELGKHHESLKDFKNALMCYDHVLQFNPTDNNKSRLFKKLKKQFDNFDEIRPDKIDIQSFHNRLQKLASTIQKEVLESDLDSKIDVDGSNKLELKLEDLLKNLQFQEAFFMARSLISEGELWAEKYFNLAKEGVLNE